MACSFEHEFTLCDSGVFPVAGIDEAGRGPLAGSVVCAAVILPLEISLHRLDDSKKLSPRRRETLYSEITQNTAIRWTVVHISSEEIDRLNILRATHAGMRRAW